MRTSPDILETCITPHEGGFASLETTIFDRYDKYKGPLPAASSVFVGSSCGMLATRKTRRVQALMASRHGDEIDATFTSPFSVPLSSVSLDVVYASCCPSPASNPDAPHYSLVGVVEIPSLAPDQTVQGTFAAFVPGYSCERRAVAVYVTAPRGVPQGEGLPVSTRLDLEVALDRLLPEDQRIACALASEDEPNAEKPGRAPFAHARVRGAW